MSRTQRIAAFLILAWYFLLFIASGVCHSAILFDARLHSTGQTGCNKRRTRMLTALTRTFGAGCEVCWLWNSDLFASVPTSWWTAATSVVAWLGSSTLPSKLMPRTRTRGRPVAEGENHCSCAKHELLYSHFCTLIGCFTLNTALFSYTGCVVLTLIASI